MAEAAAALRRRPDHADQVAVRRRQRQRAGAGAWRRRSHRSPGGRHDRGGAAGRDSLGQGDDRAARPRGPRRRRPDAGTRRAASRHPPSRRRPLRVGGDSRGARDAGGRAGGRTLAVARRQRGDQGRCRPDRGCLDETAVPLDAHRVGGDGRRACRWRRAGQGDRGLHYRPGGRGGCRGPRLAEPVRRRPEAGGEGPRHRQGVPVLRDGAEPRSSPGADRRQSADHPGPGAGRRGGVPRGGRRGRAQGSAAAGSRREAAAVAHRAARDDRGRRRCREAADRRGRGHRCRRAGPLAARARRHAGFRPAVADNGWRVGTRRGRHDGVAGGDRAVGDAAGEHRFRGSPPRGAVPHPRVRTRSQRLRLVDGTGAARPVRRPRARRRRWPARRPRAARSQPVRRPPRRDRRRHRSRRAAALP